DTSTRSPIAAAFAQEAARALGPSSATRSARVSGPRELLSTTSIPASTASLATVPPILPHPISPRVVIVTGNPARPESIPSQRYPRRRDRRSAASAPIRGGNDARLAGQVFF